MIPNYDNRHLEPIVLPSRFPNLLVNGSDGIAVGMATDIPPHNLREVCDAAIRVIDDPDVNASGTHGSHLPGPDFPTGGIICGRQGILDGYATGRGKITLRACADINEEGGRSRSSSLKCPTSRRATAWPRRSATSSRTSASRASATSRDESSARNGEPVRIVVYLKRDADPQPDPQPAVPVFAAAKDGEHHPAGPGGRPAAQYLTHQARCSKSSSAIASGDPPPHRVPDARGQAARPRPRRPAHRHLVAGRGDRASAGDAPSRAEAKVQLAGAAPWPPPCWAGRWAKSTSPPCSARSASRPSYRMTEAQAEAVVRMQLGQLAALERDEIIKEYNDLREQDRRLRTAARAASGNILAWSSRATCASCATSTATTARTEIHRRGRPAQPRRPDRRGGQRRHDQPQRLHQTAAAEHLSHAAPRRQGRLRRRGPRRRFHRTFLRRLDARLFAVLHQHAASCTGSRSTTSRRGAEPRPAGPSPTCCRCKPEEKITSVIPVRRFDERPPSHHGDAARPGEEDGRWRNTAGPRAAASSASASTRATRSSTWP